jgi:hypothetical protein
MNSITRKRKPEEVEPASRRRAVFEAGEDLGFAGLDGLVGLEEEDFDGDGFFEVFVAAAFVDDAHAAAAELGEGFVVAEAVAGEFEGGGSEEFAGLGFSVEQALEFFAQEGVAGALAGDEGATRLRRKIESLSKQALETGPG